MTGPCYHSDRRTIGYMAEILAVLFVLLLGAAGLVGLAALYLRSARPEQSDRALNANHHGLYLLVNDLVSTQDRGWTTVFPDQQSLDKARGLLAGYEDQITAIGVGLGPRRAEQGLPRPD